MEIEIDQVLCDCPHESIIDFVCTLEPEISIEIIVSPKLCMTMLQAEDSIDFQPFYLGEVLMTECQLTVDGNLGYGYCMGDEPQRAYSIAIIDAILNSQNHALQQNVLAFVEREKKILHNIKLEEYNQILKTKVDFKIMEQD
jgi:alpha-D-ribose 1-methylphosphonate 5-triphosphate synthase subunit PhnG